MALCDAASRGDLGALRAIKEHGGDVNLGDYDKRTAMHLAASDGILPVVIALVDELGAEHSPIDRWGGTPLDDAVRHEHKEVIKYLVNIGAKRANVDTSSTALCDAAAKGDINGLREIQAVGGDMNLGDYDKRTAMHLAASEGMMEVIVALVDELGAGHSPVDRWGGTPLDDALRQGHSEVAMYLLAKGAVRNVQAENDTAAALCQAASKGDIDELKKIKREGGDVNIGDYDKRTAMHLAASEGMLAIVKALVEDLGANHSPVDRWGGTPLDDALRHNHSNVAIYLISKGAAKKTATVDVSSTAMCDAASKGDLKGLRAIRDAGGDLNLGDYDMRTALHWYVPCSRCSNHGVRGPPAHRLAYLQRPSFRLGCVRSVCGEGRLLIVKALINDLGADHRCALAHAYLGARLVATPSTLDGHRIPPDCPSGDRLRTHPRPPPRLR